MFLSLFLRINGGLCYLAMLLLLFLGLNSFARDINENPMTIVYLFGVLYGLFVLGTTFMAISGVVAGYKKRFLEENWTTLREKRIREIVAWRELGMTSQVQRHLDELRDLLPGFSEEVEDAALKLEGVCENLVSQATPKQRGQRIEDLRVLLRKAQAIQSGCSSASA
jgi:hypothetical protein